MRGANEKWDLDEQRSRRRRRREETDYLLDLCVQCGSSLCTSGVLTLRAGFFFCQHTTFVLFSAPLDTRAPAAFRGPLVSSTLHPFVQLSGTSVIYKEPFPPPLPFIVFKGCVLQVNVAILVRWRLTAGAIESNMKNKEMAQALSFISRAILHGHSYPPFSHRHDTINQKCQIQHSSCEIIMARIGDPQSSYSFRKEPCCF